MTWLAALVFRRYQDRRALQHAAHTLAAPPSLHPSLGLGGRSIELSLAAGVPPNSGAFLLATEDLHSHVLHHDRDRDELIRDGQWLRTIWPKTAPTRALAQLDEDLHQLTHWQLED